MPTVNALVVNGVPISAEKHFTPTETGFNAVSVKAAATVAGQILELWGCRDCTATLVIDNTGAGSTGLASLRVDQYNAEGTAIIASFDLLTAINLKADNTVVVSWGRAAAAKHTYTSGTVLLDANADILRGGGRMKFSIVTTEVSDSTTVTATLYVVGWA